jgi:hypothetical protein
MAFSLDVVRARVQLDVRASELKFVDALELAAELQSCFHRAALTVESSGVKQVCCHLLSCRGGFEADSKTWLVSQDFLVTAAEDAT